MALTHPTTPFLNFQSRFSEKQDETLEISNETNVPSFLTDFPSFVCSDLAWSAAQFKHEEQYVYYLTAEEKFEIDAALQSFQELGLDGNLVNRSNFSLPHFQITLRHLAEDVHYGKGFCVIRGLESGKYSVEDSTVIFLGIQSYIADQRMRQDELGNMLVHVISDPFSLPNSCRANHVRYSKDSVPFHTDPDADILAFYTRSTAASGGKCIVSPGYTIYNELASARPDIIATLARPDWPFALPYFHQRPILFYHNSHLIFHFTRVSLLGSKHYPRPSSVPSLTPTQREALDTLCSLAEKHRFEISTQPGDIHFVNNLALLHRRDQFVDSETKKRHLVRMHLRNGELGWNIPEQLRGFWDEAMDEDRDEKWHVEPMPEAFFPLKLGSH